MIRIGAELVPCAPVASSRGLQWSCAMRVAWPAGGSDMRQRFAVFTTGANAAVSQTRDTV
jgi:hypothetical protein